MCITRKSAATQVWVTGPHLTPFRPSQFLVQAANGSRQADIPTHILLTCFAVTERVTSSRPSSRLSSGSHAACLPAGAVERTRTDLPAGDPRHLTGFDVAKAQPRLLPRVMFRRFLGTRAKSDAIIRWGRRRMLTYSSKEWDYDGRCT